MMVCWIICRIRQAVALYKDLGDRGAEEVAMLVEMIRSFEKAGGAQRKIFLCDGALNPARQARIVSAYLTRVSE